MAAAKNFRRNLRRAIEAQGITQRDLAIKAKTAYPYVNRVLQGVAIPSLELAERLAAAAGASLEDLIDSPKNFAKTA